MVVRYGSRDIEAAYQNAYEKGLRFIEKEIALGLLKVPSGQMEHAFQMQQAEVFARGEILRLRMRDK